MCLLRSIICTAIDYLHGIAAEEGALATSRRYESLQNVESIAVWLKIDVRRSCRKAVASVFGWIGVDRHSTQEAMVWSDADNPNPLPRLVERYDLVSA